MSVPIDDVRENWSRWVDGFFTRDIHYMEMFPRSVPEADNPSRLFIRDVMLDYMFLHSGKCVSMLDLGCATAVDYDLLSQADVPGDWLYTGVDFTQQLIDRARKLFPKDEHPHLSDFVCADIRQRLPFDDESFDVVWVRHVLEHIPDCAEAIAEACRVCSGTLLLIFYMDPQLEGSTHTRRVFPVGYGSELHETIYARPEIEACLASGSFTTTRWIDSHGKVSLRHLHSEDALLDTICLARRT